LLLGLDIPAIAEKHDVHPAQVRRLLGIAGIRVLPQEDQDDVSRAVKARGYFSIHDYVRQHPLLSYTEMSRELGISRGRLARAFRAYERAVGDPSFGRS
jgi:AraC-like DNA-binding protein